MLPVLTVRATLIILVPLPFPRERDLDARRPHDSLNAFAIRSPKPLVSSAEFRHRSAVSRTAERHRLTAQIDTGRWHTRTAGKRARSRVQLRPRYNGTTLWSFLFV